MQSKNILIFVFFVLILLAVSVGFYNYIVIKNITIEEPTPGEYPTPVE